MVVGIYLFKNKRLVDFERRIFYYEYRNKKIFRTRN